MSAAKALLVVDTNIISHALTSTQTLAYSELFGRLEEEYRFAVSGFTRYELVRSSEKSNRLKVLEYIQNEMTSFDLSNVLIDFAARVSYLYSNHKSTKGHKIADGDIINAALSIIKNCPLITMDSLDYPIPFFQEIDRQRVEYASKNGRGVMDTVYILKPDPVNIKHCFGSLMI